MEEKLTNGGGLNTEMGSIRVMLPQLMFEHGDSISDLAEVLAINWRTAKKKMQGESPLSKREIEILCERYGVTPGEIFWYEGEAAEV